MKVGCHRCGGRLPFVGIEPAVRGRLYALFFIRKEDTMELKIEYVGVNELNPYENNARKHGSVDVESIKASIKEFGFNDPIGVWKDNVIIEGHGRLMAAKALDMDKVPVIRLDELTDEQRRAYTLAHNKTAELSSWDFDILEQELAEIDFDMSEFGFENMIDADDDEPAKTSDKDLSDKVSDIYQIVIDCESESEQEMIFNRLQQEGIECRVLTL